MTFALDLQKFAQKAKDQADDAVGRIVVAVAAELDKRSPVGDGSYWKTKPPAGYVGGHFRGNWQLGIGSLPTGEKPGADPAGDKTQAAIVAAVPEDAAGRVFYLANNAPYALRIEDGWSRQAPTGLVGLTRVMFQEIVDEAVRGAQA
ncbi:hypothetical protein [Sphingobium bisphenolivorans]|uniref:hypothetical protein n=1 Tax=Sphingobium bisphenolivorans TaxID=1335760 RepID=UPI00039B9A6C|nr:hypothetical protein [Sphingobium bisphenolivorans]